MARAVRNVLYIGGPLALLAVVVAVAALAFVSCAALPVFGTWLPGYCPDIASSDSTDALTRAQERRAALQEHLGALERELLALGPCPAQVVSPDAVDPERWREQDISLFEGCWQLDSDFSLINPNTREVETVRDWKVCFEADGTGHQNFSLSNGVECAGTIRAFFTSQNTMGVEERRDIPCSDGINVTRKQGTCRLDLENRVVCEFTSRDGGRSTAQFQRDG